MVPSRMQQAMLEVSDSLPFAEGLEEVGGEDVAGVEGQWGGRGPDAVHWRMR